MSLSEAEIYCINFQNHEPKYYSRVPHIIDHLTYDSINESTGEKTQKRLSVYAIQLYRVIKSIGGDEGACWQNRDKLADLANMSGASVSNAKKELQQSFHQLEGKPLIVITKEKRKSEVNWTEYDKIIITHIWNYNNAFMALKNSKKNRAVSPNDGARRAVSPNDGAQERALSPGDTNKNNVNKNPLYKEQQPATGATSVCSLDTSSSVPSDSSKYQDQTGAISWLMGLGFDEKTANFMLKKYSAKDVENASIYLKEQLSKKKKKNQRIENILGYFRRVIDGRWWLKEKQVGYGL